MKLVQHKVIWRMGSVLYQYLRLTALFGAILPFKDKTGKFKTFTIEKLSKIGLRRCTKFGQANLNDGGKITLSLVLHFIWDFQI